jgi:hypothetical protein
VPSRPEGPARTTRGDGAKRRALHGTEHSSRLDGVMAAGNVRLERRRSRFQDVGASSAVTADDRRAARADAADDHTAATGDDYSGERQPGRERPSLESALGRSRAVKSEGRSRPGFLLRLLASSLAAAQSAASLAVASPRNILFDQRLF